MTSSGEFTVTRKHSGFTLIELLVVMAVIALLLTIAAPRYFNSLERSKEAVLKANLAGTRDALDKYYGDNGKYPDSLEVLVEKRYLRIIPSDPITGSNTTWTVVAPDDATKGQVADVKSGAEGTAHDGSAYKDW